MNQYLDAYFGVSSADTSANSAENSPKNSPRSEVARVVSELGLGEGVDVAASRLLNLGDEYSWAAEIAPRSRRGETADPARASADALSGERLGGSANYAEEFAEGSEADALVSMLFEAVEIREKLRLTTGE